MGTRRNMSAVRVARSHLENYAGRPVRLVGKVLSNDGATAVLEDAEGARVNVVGVREPFGTQFVEVSGIVQPDMTIETENVIDFGNDFDLNNYGEILKLAHGNRVRGLFE